MSEIGKLTGAFTSALAVLLVACVTEQEATREMSIDHCKTASVCSIAGSLVVTTDGHGYIAVLRQAGEGDCLNVSLPDKQNEALIGKGEVHMSVTGPVVPFPVELDVFRFEVNGRRIGYGNCGDVFVFVKD